ncbi:MAG TPA: tetratricopeptide repeat protein [bacterium]|nr:tetratricopeptide repeat protein [bacterium]
MSNKSSKSMVIILIIIFVAVILYVFLPNFSKKEISIRYPYDGALFPPEIAPPTFRWVDKISGADSWRILIEFEDNNDPITSISYVTEWTPERGVWETIKSRSVEKDALVTILGIKKSFGGKILSRNKPLSRNTITISTSMDSVGAPIFYRDVPLPFDFAREKMELIQWRLGDISKSERPPVVLENLPVCGNCHSFTPDGSTLAMDVDSGGDKGSYVITPIGEQIFLTRDKLITWSDYKREEGDPTFGLLARISPDARYVASAVKDRVIFLGRKDITFSQLFFPIKGIIAIYDRETDKFFSLPGADDPNYVQANPTWSPDGEYILFARNPVTEFVKNDKTKNAVLTLRQSAIVLGGEEYLEESTGGATYTFNVYRVPFNDGEGGTPEAVPGASHNGKSNYFARYSPDGKWIVFCQARSFMLLQPDSKLYIIPADFSQEPRLMNCNTDRMNSKHSWSPNSKWLVFSSKENSAYTELFLTHVDENGNDSPPVLLSSFSSTDRARNIPEFVNIKPNGIKQIHESFVDYYSYARKGDKLIQFGKYEEAEKSFRKSIELNPDFSISHRNLGALLTRMEREDEALKEFKIALKFDPKDTSIHNNIGTIYLNRKEYDRALESFKTSLKYDRNFAPAYEGIGVLLYTDEDIEGARKQFEIAVKLDPELPNSHFHLGTIYMNNKEYDKALVSFENVLKHELDAESYSRMGTIHFIRKEFDKAEKEFKTTLKIDPENVGALHNLGLVYMNKKEYDKAEEAFRTVYRTNPNNPNVCFMLGKVLSMNDRTIPEAISMYNKALSLNPSDVQVYSDLGSLFIKIGKKQEAIAVFERALKLSPNNQNLKAQIAELKQQR